MKAGGVSPLRVLVPVLVAAGVISGLALLLNETVAVQAHEASRRHDGDGGEVTFRRGSFWYHKGHTIYNVRDADPAARALLDVAIFELDDRGRLLRTIQAARATMGEGGPLAPRRRGDARLRSRRRRRRPRSTSTSPTPRSTCPTRRRCSTSASRRSRSRELREYRAQQEPGDTEFVRAEALLHERIAEPLASLRLRGAGAAARAARRAHPQPRGPGAPGRRCDLPVLHGAPVRRHARDPGRHVGGGNALGIVACLPRPSAPSQIWRMPR